MCNSNKDLSRFESFPRPSSSDSNSESDPLSSRKSDDVFSPSRETERKLITLRDTEKVNRVLVMSL